MIFGKINAMTFSFAWAIVANILCFHSIHAISYAFWKTCGLIRSDFAHDKGLIFCFSWFTFKNWAGSAHKSRLYRNLNSLSWEMSNIAFRQTQNLFKIFLWDVGNLLSTGCGPALVSFTATIGKSPRHIYEVSFENARGNLYTCNVNL